MRSSHLSNRNLRRTGALIGALATLVIGLSVVIGRPIMGLRGVVLPPAVEVLDTKQDADQVRVTIRNNDSNPIIGQAGYALVDSENAVIYEATPDDFGPLPPGGTQQLMFDAPPVRPDDATIQAWVREQIAYVDIPQREGLSLRDRLNQGISIDSVTLEANESNGFSLHVRFRLTNFEDAANVYRYAVGLTRLEEQTGTLVPQPPSRFSPFREVSLSPSEVRAETFENAELAVEPGIYSVSVWVQKHDEIEGFVHWAQATYAQELTVP